jgi:hypothetical protein
MFVPLGNLYEFVQGLLHKPAVCYLFYPHGTRKIKNLRPMCPPHHDLHRVVPNIICHDQEPLDWHYYSDSSPHTQHFLQELQQWVLQRHGIQDFCVPREQNLDNVFLLYNGTSIFDRSVILHSEVNSDDLDRYLDHGYLGAYYWSHAVIARDWYRYARWDRMLAPGSASGLMFLVYSRGWDGRREYRLKFAELLIQRGLLEHCRISMSHRDGELHRKHHQFQDARFAVGDIDGLDVIPDNVMPSDSSATYDRLDFNQTKISVVLETVFNDRRIHLTEKTLRPLALGHPFLLAAGAGSLAMLRRYGFRTFHPWIDESYDLETDAPRRLEMIANEMQRLAGLPPQQQQACYHGLRQIADVNREWFYSDDFARIVTTELEHNLNAAVDQAYVTRGHRYRQHRGLLRKSHESAVHTWLKNTNQREKLQALRRLRSLPNI